MSNLLKITLVTCCFNEENNLSILYQRINRLIESLGGYEWKLLIVDDGSTDNTQNIAKQIATKETYVDYINFTRNFGKEAAITAGLDYAANADAVILFDADLQHPIELVSTLLEKWQAGADMVIARPSSRKNGFFNSVFSKYFHKFVSAFSSYDITHTGGDFRLLSAKQISHLKKMRERSRYMKGMYSFPGGRIEIIDYSEEDRISGQSSFTMLKRIGLAVNGITSITAFPIRIFSIVGLAVLVLAFMYLVYIGFEIVFFGRSMPGFASLLFSVVILNGLIMIQVGIQGEYIAQLLTEAKQRPIYIVDEENSIIHD